MKKGFTLAEVLITLGIIGVIAALTIPAVISNSTQSQYVAGVKKAYNTLKGVEREAKLEYGDMADWTVADVSVSFNTYFKTYLDLLKDCGVATDDGCMVADYMGTNGTASQLKPNLATFYKVVTSDGAAYAYKLTGTTGANVAIAEIWVDTNGKKGPNRFGRDLFKFYLFNKSGIKPDGSFKPADGAAETTACVTTTGVNCTAKVLAEGEMKY